MPRWWAQIDKRLFNPKALETGGWAVLTHLGRSSGTVYRTPLDAIPVDGGFVVAVVYGSSSDWVRDVLAAGTAELTVDGDRVEITAPRVIDRVEADALLPAEAARPPRFLHIDEYLLVDVVR